MLLTAECRWFFPGEPPGRAEWFTAADPAPAPEERTDRYLRLGGCEGVGVKVRGDRLEIKARQGDPWSVSWCDGGATGRAARWLKWTSGDPVAELARAAGQSRAEWIAVHKRRWSRVFLVAGETVREVALGDELGPRDGVCRVEVARIAVDDGAPFWTLGLEGSGAEPEAMLERVAPGFLEKAALPVELEEADSLSYPQWLLRPRSTS